MRSARVAVFVTAAVAAFGLGLTGCASTTLASARANMAAGQYAAAHQDLESALQNPAALHWGEHREVMDDLCTTEVQIGAPTYSLLRQHQTCMEAAKEPGSISGDRLSQLDATIRQEHAVEIDSALKSGDMAGAVGALLVYQKIEPNDRAGIARWNQEIWSLVDRQDREAAKGKRASIGQALAVLGSYYRSVRSMSQSAFKRWLGKDTSTSGESMLSGIEIKGKTLKLTVPNRNLPDSALSPQKFAQINDAFSVWCRCDGATHVASDDTGLPVYLAHINLLTARSEVLALPWR